jgi:DNA-binding transcriptional regulator LsrR (DeoR family)
MPRKRSERDPNLVFLVAKLFFDGKKVREIVEDVNKLMPAESLNREGVYPLLAEAKRLGYVRLSPPLEGRLAAEVANKFQCKPEHITVVRTPGAAHNEHVAQKAAELTLDLIRKAEVSSGKRVGLGLGPGRATLDFSRALGELLRSEIDVPGKIDLFAICAGCPAKSPAYSSTSFFNLFPKEKIHECVGLFAETVVPSGEFEKIKKRPGVAEAFELRDKVSIIVTSMGDFQDEHDLLSMFLAQSGANLEELRNRGWIGSVQYRPYSATEPIKESPEEMRAVTLFELDDFVRIADSKNKHVVLIARQCGACEKTRAATLRPLLTAPRLRVWSELVMDEATARELLSDAPGDPPPG